MRNFIRVDMRSYQAFSFLLSLVLLLSFTPVFATASASKALSRVDAMARSGRVTNISYSLEIVLTATSTDYDATSTIQFNLAETKPNNLNLDFDQGTVKQLVVNGKAVTINSRNYYGNVLVLPAPLLKTGDNTVRVVFKKPFSKSGDGFYRFVDPEDQRVYIFSDFEPFNAHRFMPCFDQPDLKGRFKLTVTTPTHWQVISTMREEKIEEQKDAHAKIWFFPESKPISPYVFSLHAGEYQVWEGKAGALPLRLLARQSLAKYVDYKEWLEVTAQGFSFYEKYFDYAYPFEKYDQVLVPDFNWGGMENVAAVTYSEKYAYREVPTLEERFHRADVILHELAHMWFGDLVTMKWWDDLWLNESFASYMSALAMSKATSFSNVWEDFYAGMKQDAYFEDQLVTNHPIATPVLDTDQAFTNFDGITYGKGAAMLKQLDFYLGDNKFRDGVRSYFKTYAFKNTELKNFIEALSQASGKDLTNFSKTWLEEKGVDSITAVYQCEKRKVTSFKIVQTPPEGQSLLREHRTEIGFFEKAAGVDGRISLQNELSVTYSGSETVVRGLNGEPCPYIVSLNMNDQDFIKVILDERTLGNVKYGISRIPTVLDRLMMWQALWDMVRDQRLDVFSYSNLVRENLPSEKNSKILIHVLGTIVANHGGFTLLNYLPRDAKKFDEQKRSQFIKGFEQLAWHSVHAVEAGSDLQKNWLDFYIHLAESAEAQNQLLELLSGKQQLDKLVVGQERRWSIIGNLCANGHLECNKLIKAEALVDRSSLGKDSALACEVLRPDLKNKLHWFEQITKPKSTLNLNQKREIIYALLPKTNDALGAALEARIFGTLPVLAKQSNQEHFLSLYVEHLIPALCSKEHTLKLDKLIAANPKFPAYVRKALLVGRQENGRCEHARALGLANAKKSL